MAKIEKEIESQEYPSQISAAAAPKDNKDNNDAKTDRMVEIRSRLNSVADYLTAAFSNEKGEWSNPDTGEPNPYLEPENFYIFETIEEDKLKPGALAGIGIGEWEADSYAPCERVMFYMENGKIVAKKIEGEKFAGWPLLPASEDVMEKINEYIAHLNR